MIEEIKRAGSIIGKYLDHVKDQNDKIIVILDNDPLYMKTLERVTKGDQNIITISDTEEFRSFIMRNGCNKMYIDIRMDGLNGVDFAEEFKLNDRFGELIFVSGWPPDYDTMKRIEALGSKFVSKSELLDTIIYPRGA